MTNQSELKTIHKLSQIDRELLASSIIFPSYSTIIEELVLNSLEANSTKVEILLDLERFDIQVNDNGDGIDPSHLSAVGNWHMSSKEIKHSFGARGQSIAALRSICKSIEVASRWRSNQTTFVKLMVSGHDEIHNLNTSELRGTLVTLKRIFYCLPVRQKSLNLLQELAATKDIVEKMSILHHEVTFTMRDAKNNHILFHSVGQASIAKKLSTIYGLDLVSKLVHIIHSNGKFRLEGFLSPPTQLNYCFSNKIQLVYYNHRWIKQKEPISAMINEFYSKYFKTLPDCAPVAMHAPTVEKCPYFMFTLTFEENEISILRDGDKVTPLFTNQFLFRSFMIECFQKHFSRDYPDFCQALSSGNPVISQMPDLPVKENRLFSVIAPSEIFRNSGDDFRIDGSLFSYAFLSTRQPAEGTQLKPQLDHSAKVEIPVESKSFHLRSSPSELKISGQSVKFARKNPSSNLEYQRKMQNNAIERMSEHFGVYPTDFNTIEQCASFDSSFIVDLKVVGQWDHKYIIAFNKTTKTLVAFDQHAVDERIKYDSFMKEEIEEVVLENPIDLLLTEDELFVLQVRSKVINVWGFHFTLHERCSQMAPLISVITLPKIVDEQLNIDDLREFISFIRGNLSAPDQILQPPAIRRVLMYKACRSAIKFGDSLSLEECQHLISQLATVSLPFQCAHGRPSMLPLISMT